MGAVVSWRRRALPRKRFHFRGCTATQHLHADHIHHWIRGGTTELDNMFLVPYHHRLLHDGGWTITGLVTLLPPPATN